MKTIALLIDGDNAQLGSTEQIIQFCKGYGTLKIKNAYGDWQKSPLSAHVQTIKELGVKLVQQGRVVPNATDFALSMAAAVMLDKKEADIYVIVSSDNHFTVVCDQIRQKGAKVYGIGSKKQASSKLRKACNKFNNVEDIVENQSKQSTKDSTALAHKPKAVPKPKATSTPKVVSAPKVKATPKSTPKAKPAPKLAPKPTKTVVAQATRKTTTMLKLLIQAYQKAPQKDGWVLLPQIREILSKIDTHFDQRFSGKKLSTWIKAFDQNFVVEGDRVRMT